MDGANAVRYEDPDQGPTLSAPLGEIPVAAPGIRNALTLMLLLAVPLWAAIIGAVYLVIRVVS